MLDPGSDNIGFYSHGHVSVLRPKYILSADNGTKAFSVFP